MLGALKNIYCYYYYYYYLNKISFKCSPLIFKLKLILRTVFSMTFSKISGVILLISSMMLFFNYRQMIQEYLLPQLKNLDMQNLWLQQDGATPHTARETMAILYKSCLSWSFNFTFWWRSMATTVSWFNPSRFFPMGIP